MVNKKNFFPRIELSLRGDSFKVRGGGWKIKGDVWSKGVVEADTIVTFKRILDGHMNMQGMDRVWICDCHMDRVQARSSSLI